MKLIHFSDQPLEKIEYRVQKEEGFKPQGLWVSDEDEFGWKQWCESEGYRAKFFKYAYKIELIDDHNVLILRTVEEIKQLTELYSIPGLRDPYNLDWLAMSERWDGLIITPYQWELRLDFDHRWYYGWDCASGCIWNLTAIESWREEEDTCQSF